MQNGTAIDISNYTGELSDGQIDWIRQVADLVIVRLSTENNRAQRQIAAQQTRALAARGVPWQGYLWCYWGWSPFEHWKRATELLDPSWPAYYSSQIWLDMEDDAPDQAAVLDWINAYARILTEDEFQPGVYTGKWWIDKHKGAFDGGREVYWRSFPLWWANYTGRPACQQSGTHPWDEVAMHQYKSVDRGDALSSYDLSHICAEL